MYINIEKTRSNYKNTNTNTNKYLDSMLERMRYYIYYIHFTKRQNKFFSNKCKDYDVN